MENKIDVIKAIRKLTNSSLKEALDMCNGYGTDTLSSEQRAIVARAIDMADSLSVKPNSVMEDNPITNEPGNTYHRITVTFDTDELNLTQAERYQIEDYFNDLGFSNVHIHSEELNR